MTSAAATGAPRGRSWFGQGFMLAIAAIVVFGFSHSVDKALIRPARPANPILYLHLLLCVSWLALMIVQAGLVSHRCASPQAVRNSASMLAVTK